MLDSTGELLSFEHVNSMCSEMVNSSRCGFFWLSKKSELSLFLLLLDVIDFGCLTTATLTGKVDVDNEQHAESSSFRNELERQPESDEPDKSC